MIRCAIPGTLRMNPFPRCVLLALASASLAGCAGYSAAKQGEQALARHQFEAAVAFYEEAVKAKPGDEDYLAGLQRARHEAAQDAQLQGDDARNRGDLNAAERRLRRAGELEASPEVAARLEAIVRERAEASAALSASEAELAAGRLEAGLVALRRIENYAPTFPRIAPLIDQTSRNLCEQAIGQSRAAFERRDFPGALSQAQRALAYRPGDEAGTAQLQRVQARLRSEQAAAQGAQLLEQRRFREAVLAYQQAVLEDPHNEPVLLAHSAAREALARALGAEADAALRAGREGKALALLREASSQFVPGPQRADLEGRAARLVARLAARLDQRQAAASQAGLVGAAWAFALAASKLRGVAGPTPDLTPFLRYRVELVPAAPGGPFARRVLGELAAGLSRTLPAGVELVAAGTQADAELRVSASAPRYAHTVPDVEQRSAEYVARIDWVANPRHHDLQRHVQEVRQQQREVAARLAGERDALRVRQQAVDRAAQAVAREREEAHRRARHHAERLQREAGADATRAAVLAVEIGKLEREIKQLDERLRVERDVKERTRLETRRAEAKKTLDADRHDRDEAQRAADARLRQARQITENPPATEDLRRAQAEYERARGEADDFASRVVAPREADLARLERSRYDTEGELARTPDRVQRPAIAVYTYGVEHHRLAASAAAAVTLTDRLLGEERARVEASSEKAAQDTAFPGARVRGEPDLYLPPDPLDLPSEDVFERDLATELAGRALGPVGPALADHRARFAAAARRSQGDARLHFWALALQPGGALDAAAQAEAGQALLAATGLDLATGQVAPERLDPP